MGHYKCGYRATDTDTITKETAEAIRRGEGGEGREEGLLWEAAVHQNG